MSASAQVTDGLFAEAAAAAVPSGGNDVLAPLNTAVCRQLRVAWARIRTHQNRPIVASVASGACQSSLCKGKYMEIRLFTVADEVPVAPHAVINAEHGHPRLHACAGRPLCDPDAHPSLHVTDVTTAWRTKRLACVQPGSQGGGVYWCERHTRMHVCGPACEHTYTDTLGFKCCVLSGQTVAHATEIAYGNGLAILSDEKARQRSIDTGAERKSKRRRRTQTPLDKLIREAPSAGVDLSEPAGDATAEYIDLDAPAEDLFADDLAGNTFGDGMAESLLGLYTQSYATVHHIVFGPERAGIEAGIVEGRVREAEMRISQYFTDQTKAGKPVDLSMCRQLEDHALTKSKRIFKRLLVPVNGIARMQAYYAIVCTEFFMQMSWELLTMLQDTLPKRVRQDFERFLAYNGADVAPNILDIMHEGLRVGEHVIVPVESLLQNLFPESLTLDKLGIAQKTCTEVKKLLKRCVIVVIEAKRPVFRLQTTQLDMNAVLRGADPVLTMFMEARRGRLDMTQ